MASGSAVADGLSDIAASPQRESVVAKLVQHTIFAQETASYCDNIDLLLFLLFCSAFCQSLVEFRQTKLLKTVPFTTFNQLLERLPFAYFS